MKKINPLLTLIADAVIVLMVIVSLIMMFQYTANSLDGGGWDAFKFFTVDSNVLLMACALVAIPFDVLVLLKKREASPRFVKILMLVGAAATGLTFLTVVAFLGPTMGWEIMFVHMNLFMHLLTPLMGFARYLLCGFKEEKIRFVPDSFYAAIPMILYGIIYLINVATHDGYGNPDYDWYGFGAYGPVGVAISFLATLSVIYGIGVGLHFGQRAIQKAFEKK